MATSEKTTGTNATRAAALTVTSSTTVGPTASTTTGIPTTTSTTGIPTTTSTIGIPTTTSTTGIPTTTSTTGIPTTTTTTGIPTTTTTTGIPTTTSTISTAKKFKITSTTVPTTPTTTATTSTTSTTTTTTAAITTVSSIAFARLFEYGEKAGDQKLTSTATDVSSPVFKPEICFPFGKTLNTLLYFTDNGLIVFPPSESEIFPYTNPNEFTTSSKPPMIAVFWSDADLSAGVGAVFYQEYKIFGSESPSLIQDVETTIKKYSGIQYKAKWTLKITWDKVPAHPAAETETKTNTYQAVVTTDGSYSFVLMLYESGGMKWDVSRLTSKNVVIGFNSGDGFFKNDEQMNLPDAERYRPDKHKGTNTDLKGLWLYQLIQGTPQKNYKTECLSWFTLEPDPSQWNQNLLSCPCTFSQGEEDKRFRKYKLDASTKVLRKASPNAFNAGQRCVYNKKNAFIEGWQERYWASFTQSSSSTKNQEFDLNPYNWCCENIDNPTFCKYYEQKRPSINCGNYKPPTRAMMVGDPHFITLDGLSYTFNGLGDFVLLNVIESSGTTIFKLHGRTVQTGTAQATNFMAFAAQHISTKTTTVQMILKGSDSIDVLLNNDAVLFTPLTEDNKEIYHEGTFYLEKSGNASMTASFGGGISLTVSAKYGMLTAITNLPEDYMNQTKGLLGVWNGNPNDDLTMPNGSVIPTNSKESTIFNYGITWEVPSDSSIFTSGRIVSRAANNSFKPLFLDDLQQQNATLYNMLAIECKNNTQCIFDSISTGQKTIGLATAMNSIEFAQVNEVLNSYPPTIQGKLVIYTQLLQQMISHYTAMDKKGNTSPFSPYVSPDLNVTENGTLIWLPKTTNEISFEIEAVGSNNLSSVITPRLVICDCGENGECITNETTRINGSSVYKAACKCSAGFTSSDCRSTIGLCQTLSCFSGVNCSSSSGCGSCPTGLTGDGTHCSDIDECKDNNPCSPNATCIDIVKSYNCTCNPGFSGNGTFCSDINECDSSPCSPNAVCNNTAGNFSCTCNQGFTGNGTTCTALPGPCDSSQCPSSFCSNGGTCVLNPADSCKPFCQCPSQYKGEQCTLPRQQFIPQPLLTIPKRSVNITLRISGPDNRNSTDDIFLTNITTAKVFGSTSKLQRFTNNSKPVFWLQGGTVTAAVVLFFSYNGNKTVIDFLNDRLHVAIMQAFNTVERFNRDLTSAYNFEPVASTDIQDITKLSYKELLNHFSCNNTKFVGYELQWDDQDGVICRSPCDMNYCLHQAECRHLTTGPLCICVPRTLYSSYGDRCEHLSMNLRAFFGILFGALAFLLLLMLAIFLIVWKCTQPGRERLINDTSSTENAEHHTTFSWQKNSFSSKLQNTHVLPSLDNANLSAMAWKPHLGNVSSAAEIKIERPSLKMNGVDLDVP